MKKQKISRGIHEREYYVSKILTKEELKKRWEDIGYEPKAVQLQMFN